MKVKLELKACNNVNSQGNKDHDLWIAFMSPNPINLVSQIHFDELNKIPPGLQAEFAYIGPILLAYSTPQTSRIFHFEQ